MSNPAVSSVHPGAPSPPLHLLHMSWCGSMNRDMPCLLGALDRGAQAIEVLLVVQSRPRVLHGFPGDQVAQEHEPPFAQAREVLIGLPGGKGPFRE